MTVTASSTADRPSSASISRIKRRRLPAGKTLVALLVMLFLVVAVVAYVVVFGVILAILDWYRRPAPEIPEVPPRREAMAAAVAIPASRAP